MLVGGSSAPICTNPIYQIIEINPIDSINYLNIIKLNNMAAGVRYIFFKRVKRKNNLIVYPKINQKLAPLAKTMPIQ